MNVNDDKMLIEEIRKIQTYNEETINRIRFLINQLSNKYDYIKTLQINSKKDVIEIKREVGTIYIEDQLRRINLKLSMLLARIGFDD